MRRVDFTYSDDRHTWDVQDLWAAAEGLEPFELPLADIPDIDNVLSGRFWSKGGIGVMGYEERESHEDRVGAANLDYPIILTPTGSIADGCHRVIKCFQLGRTSLSAVRLPRMPTPLPQGLDR